MKMSEAFEAYLTPLKLQLRCFGQYDAKPFYADPKLRRKDHLDASWMLSEAGQSEPHWDLTEALREAMSCTRRPKIGTGIAS